MGIEHQAPVQMVDAVALGLQSQFAWRIAEGNLDDSEGGMQGLLNFRILMAAIGVDNHAMSGSAQSIGLTANKGLGQWGKVRDYVPDPHEKPSVENLL